VADFNPLAATDHADQVRRLLGEELSLGSVSPEIALALVLESDRPEWAFLRNARLFSSGILSIAANVGHVSQVDLFNPAGSGIIVVVRSVIIFAATAGNQYQLSLDGGAAGGVGVGNFLLDQRYPLPQRTTCQNFLGNGAVGVSGNSIENRNGPASANDIIFEIPRQLGVIVAPGRRINLFSAVQNVAVNAMFAGYERRARPEELVV
jgi:hypothetical protein